MAAQNTANVTPGAPTYPVSQAPTFDMFQLNQAPLINAVNAATDQAAGPYYSQGFKGITVALNVTAISAASLTVFVEGYDQASGQYFPILTSGAITAQGITSHTIYAGLTNASGAGLPTLANNILPAVFRIRVHVTGGTASFTVGAVLTT